MNKYIKIYRICYASLYPSIFLYLYIFLACLITFVFWKLTTKFSVYLTIFRAYPCFISTKNLLSIYLYICLSIYPVSTFLSIHLSIYLRISVFIIYHYSRKKALCAYVHILIENMTIPLLCGGGELSKIII